MQFRLTRTATYILGAIGGVVVLIIVVLFLLDASQIGGGGEKVSLQFWGVFDPEEDYQEAIREYESAHPNVDITYRQIPFEDYEQILVSSFASQNGPDIWLMHNTWLPKHYDLIAPMPEKVGDEQLIRISEFKQQFVDVTVQDLTSADGRIFALPLYVDTLALYYNKDIFNSVGLSSPPATWEEFNNAVKILRQTDGFGNIVRAGAAIGTARNINRSTDILMLLMLQSGVRMTNVDNDDATFANSIGGIPVGELALQYYTDFANPNESSVYTWDDEQHYSIDAFIQGEATMMFNYSHHIPTIRSRSARFNFGIAPMPQPEGAAVNVNYANYWAPTVSKASDNIGEAWKFINYLSSAQGVDSFLRESGRPAARRDMIEQQRFDVDLGVFAVQALSARSWYQIDNVAIEKIFADMIDEVTIGRRTIRDALQAAQREVDVLMSRASL